MARRRSRHTAPSLMNNLVADERLQRMALLGRFTLKILRVVDEDLFDGVGAVCR